MLRKNRVYEKSPIIVYKGNFKATDDSLVFTGFSGEREMRDFVHMLHRKGVTQEILPAKLKAVEIKDFADLTDVVF